MTNSVIELRQVGHRFGDRNVLREISLSVRSGEFYGIVGPNGAGKTTTLRIMQGLLKPSSGDVLVFDTAPYPPKRAQNRRIGVQPQKVALFELLTVREQLHLFADIRGISRKRADETAVRLGLDDSMDVRQEKLSGGQRQRLSVACAIVGEPDLLFLDEPTANVDPVARREMRTLFLELASTGVTIVYTSHDLNEIAGLCDTVTVLARGEVLVTNSPEKISRANGLTTMEVTSDKSAMMVQMSISGIVGANLTDTGVTLVASDEQAALREVLAIDPNARIINRMESFEDTYVRLITATGGAS